MQLTTVVAFVLYFACVRQFSCSDGHCLPFSKVCDKVQDCYNGADEKNCAKAGCSSAHCDLPKVCMETTAGHLCVCPAGTVLENEACIDIDECADEIHSCTQRCKNTFGSYRCACEQNYSLEPDGLSCKALLGSPVLFYSEGSSIHGLDVRENTVIEVATFLHGPVGVAYDPNTNQVLWTEVGEPRIRSVPFLSSVDSPVSTPSILTGSGLQQPEGIVVDWLGKLFYYSDLKTGVVSACTLNGSFCTVVIQSVGNLRGIALHPEKRLLFFSDWSNDRPMIEVAGMDGSQRRAIITTGIRWPNGLTVDVAQNALYWVDGGLDKIERCSFDGTYRRVVISGVRQPFAIAVFENTMYWSDWSTSAVKSADKITGKNQKLVVKHRTVPLGISLYHPHMLNIKALNPCKKAKCSHICLASPRKRGFRCACPNGFELLADKRSCQPLAEVVVTVDSSSSDSQSEAITLADMAEIAVTESTAIEEQPDTVTEAHLVCKPTEYKCKCGHCINKRAICDGMKDCPLGDDEKGCQKPADRDGAPVYHHSLPTKDGCSLGKVPCDGGQQCISSAWVCDGQVDCRNGEDEAACHVAATVAMNLFGCTVDEFRCGTKECINRSLLCDGKSDCRDSSDEDGWCQGCKEDNGGCELICLNTPDGTQCACPKGWLLADDGRHCEDMDECQSEVTNDCDHFCENRIGSYQCSCASNYLIERDGKTCTPNEKEGFVFFSVGHEIRNMPLFGADSPGSFGVIMETRWGKIVGLDYSIRDNRYYYTDHDGGSIFANNTDNVCLIEGLYYPQNVRVDWVTGNIYFTNDLPGVIGICTSDGHFCRTLVKENLLRPRGLAVHPRKGLLFWTDWGNYPRIERTFLDGSSRTAIVTEKVIWPNAVSIDYIHDHLYWIDAQLDIIGRSNLDGSNRIVVMSKGLHSPFDLVVFDHRIFWSDWGLKSILVSDLRNITVRRILNTTYGPEPYGLTISHSVYQDADISNPCATAQCSHICALGPNSSATCLCPDGYEMSETGKDCYFLTRQKRLDNDFNYSPRLCASTWTEACRSGICMHGGECQPDEYDRMECMCPEGYSGLFCEVSSSITASPGVSTNAPRLNNPTGQGRRGWIVGLLLGITFCLCILGISLYHVCRRNDYYGISMKGQHANVFLHPKKLFLKRITTLDDHNKQQIVDHEYGSDPHADQLRRFITESAETASFQSAR